MKKREFLKTTGVIVGGSVVGPFAKADNAPAQRNEIFKVKTDSKKFDYIIVGGGTAGPVLAARLSENQTIQYINIIAQRIAAI